MDNQKGFTLIEMLVVIAVVGILSAAVLASLGPARNKAKDARIISGLNQVRAIAEILYDGDYAEVTLTQPDVAKIVVDITANQGALAIDLTDTTSLNYRANSSLVSGGYYCVDSAGFAGELASAPSADGACQ